jgi:HemY protein
VLRALWFFFQLAVVVCAAIWIASQQGTVDVVWNDYTVSLHLGIFLLFLTLFTLIAVAFFRLVGAIVGAPVSMSRRRRERNRKKGFQALTRGFVAIAAGDGKKATGYAKDVRHLLPDETGLPLLLEAQAARLRGEESAARNSFEQLLGDKDAAFFGIRGLLKSSLDEGDAVKALGYAKTALDKNPKQPWILKSVYDLELQNHHWHAAMTTLERVRKAKAIDEAQARKDEIALLMILAEEDRISSNENGWLKKIERVLKLDPGFTPAAIKLGEHYLVKNKNGKVVGIVERAWKFNPHPDLAVLWDKLAPENKASDPLRRLRWFEKLVAVKPDSVDGQLAAAKAAMEAGLAGEAKAHLTMAENLRPTAQVYRLRADLEEQTSRNATVIREWMDKAASAAPDSVWYCTQTRHIYERWSPVAQPHGSFNTIEWGSPLGAVYAQTEGLLSNWKDPLMIEKT